jgi:hypothetical protein
MQLQRVMTVAVVVVFAAIAVADRGIKLVDSNGVVVGDADVKAVERVPMPKHVVAASEGTLWSLRRGNDVVVLAVTQQYDCDQCAATLRDFAIAASHFSDTPKGAVAFATLDAVEEADEYSLLIGEHPDAHWLVPSLLIVKRDFQERYRRPPFNFLLNENTARDLPKFVKRLIGPDTTTVATEDELLARVKDPATDRVSFAIWPWSQVARNAIERVVEDERLHSYFSVVKDGPLANQDDLRDRHNPGGDFFTAHVVNDKDEVEVFGTSLAGAKTYSAQVNGIREFVTRHKLRRPGHQHDGKTEIETEDYLPDNSCEGKPVVKRTDRIVASATGTNIHTGSKFMSFEHATFDVSQGRGELPPNIARTAFLGLCAPARRVIVLPPRQHFRVEGGLPQGVGVEDGLRIEVTLHEISAPKRPSKDEL